MYEYITVIKTNSNKNISSNNTINIRLKILLLHLNLEKNSKYCLPTTLSNRSNIYNNCDKCLQQN